jgi:DNA-binding transcriptional LysR family regulator
MRINLTLQQLEAFTQVTATGSFRAAALALGVSQPALSRTIRLAEQTLGTRLFDRDTRNVNITATGRELLPVARRILHDFDSALSELGQFMEGRSGRVTVAALPSAGVALVPKAIAAFRRIRPQAEFSLVEAPADNLVKMVEEGRADFGISVRPPPDQRLHYRHVREDPFLLLCRRDDPLAAQSTAGWSVFGSRPFIASSPSSSIRPITDAVFMRRRTAIKPAFEYPSVAACGAMVAAGLGITALPRLAIELVAMQELTTIPLRSPNVSRSMGIVTRIGRSLSPVAKEFLEIVSAGGGEGWP